VAEQVEVSGGACGDWGGHGFTFASSDAERKALWAARHSTYYAALALRPGTNSKGIITDACVPISKLADVMQATAADVAASEVCGPIFGHAGDGNFHCILVVGDEDEAGSDYLERVEGVNERLIKATLAAGGTCTGEHGVGSGKRKYLRQQFGPAAVNAMRAIKAALDPEGILNPGKVLPDDNGDDHDDHDDHARDERALAR
jgi:D-lactate dehydrogenase (cytochrome)